MPMIYKCIFLYPLVVITQTASFKKSKTEVTPSKNLGLLFDAMLNFDKQIDTVVKGSFSQLSTVLDVPVLSGKGRGLCFLCVCSKAADVFTK